MKDGTLLMQQAMELGLKPKLFVGAGAGFTLPEFQKAASKAANHVFSATLWYQTLPYEGAQAFFDAYEKRFGTEAEYHGAEAYAAVQVIADVLRRSKSLSGEDVKQALAETDMQTVFGPVKFQSFWGMTNQNKLPTYVVQWLDGRLELVWPREVASKEFVYPIDWERAWK